MSDKASARELIEQRLDEAYLAGMLHSHGDREKFKRAWLEILRLSRTANANLEPTPVKGNEFLAPLPQRQPIDSQQKLDDARAKRVELERLEARLVSIPPLKRMPADDDKLRYTRAEIAALSAEIKAASAMERRTANG